MGLKILPPKMAKPLGDHHASLRKLRRGGTSTYSRAAMDNCRRRMLAHLGQPLYAKTEQRFDIRWRYRSRPFYYIVKVQIEATSLKIGPEYCRIAAFVLDRNGKLKFAIQVGPFEGALIVDLYNWVHSY